MLNVTFAFYCCVIYDHKLSSSQFCIPEVQHTVTGLSVQAEVKVTKVVRLSGGKVPFLSTFLLLAESLPCSYHTNVILFLVLPTTKIQISLGGKWDTIFRPSISSLTNIYLNLFKKIHTQNRSFKSSIRIYLFSIFDLCVDTFF